MSFTSVAVSGPTAVADGQGSAYVFNPSGASAPTQAPALDVFSEPAAGWSGAVPQAAQLSPSDGALIVGVAVSGPTVVAAGTKGSQSALYVFTKPKRLVGAAHETASLSLPPNAYSYSVSLDGHFVLANGVIFGSTAVSHTSPHRGLTFAATKRLVNGS